jgi:hypothetical protein
MSDRTLRSWLRWSHLTLGLVLLLYLFSPYTGDPTVTMLVRLGVLPMLFVTGLWMWSQISTARFSDKTD